MDPISASALVALLVTCFKHVGAAAVEPIDEALKSGLTGLLHRIQRHFAADPVAGGALDRLEAEPDNTRRPSGRPDQGGRARPRRLRRRWGQRHDLRRVARRRA